MVTRVIGFPDQNGIITISCGGDIIEIQVATHSGQAIAGSYLKTGNDPVFPADKPYKNPFGLPFAAAPLYGEVIWHNPHSTPYHYFASPILNGSLDTSEIVKQVLDQIADENQGKPCAVVLGLNKVNLHELSDLSQKIRVGVPDLPIAIDFGGVMKP